MRGWGIGSIGLISAVVVLVACQPPTAVDHNPHTNPWLNEVSADSPVLIANHRPLDDEQWNRLFSVVPMAQRLGMDRSLDRHPSLRPWLDHIQTADGWRSAGFDPNGFFAVYAQHDRLIARLPLSDEATFWRWWAQVRPARATRPPAPAAAGAPEENGATVPIRLPFLGTTESVVQLATTPDHLTVIWQSATPQATAQTNPSQSGDEWSAAAWSEFNQTHQFDGHLSGYIDIGGWLTDLTTVSAACRALLQQAAMPIESIRFGTRQLSADEVRWRGEIASPLWALADAQPAPAPIPIDLDTVKGAGIAGVGASFNLIGLRETLLAWADTATVGSSACPLGNTWAGHHRGLKALANRPIPPIFSSLRGVTSRLDGWPSEGSDATPDYFTEIFLRNPQFLLGLAQMFSPDLAQLNLQPNQAPAEVPESLTQALGGVAVYLSTTSDSIRASGTASAHGESPAPPTGEGAQSMDRVWFVGTVQLDRLDALAEAADMWPSIQFTDRWIKPMKDWAQASRAKQIDFQMGGGDSSLEVELQIIGPRPQSRIQ